MKESTVDKFLKRENSLKTRNAKLSEELSSHQRRITELEELIASQGLEIARLQSSNSSLSHLIELLCKVSGVFMSRIHVLESVPKDVNKLISTNTALSRTIVSLKVEIAKLRNRLEFTSKKVSYLDSVLSKSSNSKFINRGDFNALTVNGKYYLYTDALKKIDLLNKRLSNTLSQSIPVQKAVQSKEILGIFIFSNGFYFFKSLDSGQVYSIANDSIEATDYFVDSPCVAEINNSVATIVRFLSTKKFSVAKRVKATKHRVVKESHNDFKFDKGYRVLLIGNGNKDLYVSSLSKLGLNVTYIDSYGVDINRLIEMLNRHDFIICFKNHSKQSFSKLVMQFSECDQYKFNIINSDSVSKLVDRLRFCIENTKSLHN